MTCAVSLMDLFREGAPTNVRDLRGARVHLIGIGGSGMAGLAAMLIRCGARVSGSDLGSSAATQRLAHLGARILDQSTHARLPEDAELVIASAAIKAEHPELIEAARRETRVLKYAEMLGVMMDALEGVAISGTHGKSTTTAWLAFVLRSAGLDPSFVIGAEVEQLGGGSGVGDGPHFVVEACEYDRSFLNLRPRRAAILNIEEDHLDCYSSLTEIESAFAAFVSQVREGGLVVTSADLANCLRTIRDHTPARIESFGESADADWRASAIRVENGAHSFDLHHRGTMFGRVALGLSGRHNVHNALAVAALAHDCGVPKKEIISGLQNFTGARRRLELKARVHGVVVADDYGHHPTEIRATLAAARERYSPKRLWCVFQPHQHSRTRFLLNDFAHSFAQADRVIVPEIYFVRDSERDRASVSAVDLVREIGKAGGNAEFIPNFADIVDKLANEARPGDLVLTMGAGNIWNVADALVEQLRADR